MVNNSFFTPIDGTFRGNAASVEKFSVHYKDGEVPFLGQILTFFISACQMVFVFLPPK